MTMAQAAYKLTIEDARQLVQSLPDRILQFDNEKSETSNELNAMTLVAAGAGAILTMSAFTSRLPYGLRVASGVGAALALGTAMLVGASSLSLRKQDGVMQKEFKPFLDALSSNAKMQQELAEHFVKTLERDALYDKKDWEVLEEACRFGESKGLLKPYQTRALEKEACESGSQSCLKRRYQNSNTGKSVMLAFSG